MFLGESDAFQTRECNIQLVIYALPHFLSNRQNGINNWSTKGQHLLLSGFVEKVERGGQDGECFLLSFQHLFSSGHGDDGSWRKHSQPDVRGTTHARARTHTHTQTQTVQMNSTKVTVLMVTHPLKPGVHSGTHTLDLFHQRDAMSSPKCCGRITRSSRGFSFLFTVCAGFEIFQWNISRPVRARCGRRKGLAPTLITHTESHRKQKRWETVLLWLW